MSAACKFQRSRANARAANPSNPRVCFTGAQPRQRSDLEQMVVENGGEVLDRVTKGLTYLVMADPGSGSSKAKMAREYGTECVDLAALEKVIREGGGVVVERRRRSTTRPSQR